MRRAVVFLILLILAVAVLPPLFAQPLGLGPDPAHLPPRVRTVPLADGRGLHVVDRGAGTPVVLVHGCPGTAAEWSDFASRLRELGPYRSVAYDRVGYGYSARESAGDDAYTYASSARELEALLDALAIERAVVVGWSFGGGVAQTLAASSPGRVSHLVLVGSTGPRNTSHDPTALDRITATPFGGALLRWVASIPPLARWLARSSMADAFARPEAIPEGWLDYSVAAFALPGTPHAIALEASRSDPRVLRPSALDVPSLVVHGADDYLVPYSVGEDLHARLPDSEFLPVLNGSHMIPVTHPGELARAVHEHVGAY